MGYEMGGAYGILEENEMHLGYKWEKSKEKNNNLENLHIDWRMILKLTLKK